MLNTVGAISSHVFGCHSSPCSASRDMLKAEAAARSVGATGLKDHVILHRADAHAGLASAKPLPFSGQIPSQILSPSTALKPAALSAPRSAQSPPPKQPDALATLPSRGQALQLKPLDGQASASPPSPRKPAVPSQPPRLAYFPQVYSYQYLYS